VVPTAQCDNRQTVDGRGWVGGDRAVAAARGCCGLGLALGVAVLEPSGVSGWR